jgi:hypothetical protein
VLHERGYGAAPLCIRDMCTAIIPRSGKRNEHIARADLTRVHDEVAHRKSGHTGNIAQPLVEA